MGLGLDPKQTAQSKFEEDYPLREAFARKANTLEPPFPWKIIPFDPLVFHLGEVPYPDDDKDT